MNSNVPKRQCQVMAKCWRSARTSISSFNHQPSERRRSSLFIIPDRRLFDKLLFIPVWRCFICFDGDSGLTAGFGTGRADVFGSWPRSKWWRVGFPHVPRENRPVWQEEGIHRRQRTIRSKSVLAILCRLSLLSERYFTEDTTM